MKVLLICYLLCVVLVSIVTCDGSRILGVFPTPSISHQVVFRPFMNELARRGHHVVTLTTDPVENPRANLTQIDVRDISYELIRQNPLPQTVSRRVFLEFWFKFMTELNDRQLSSPQVKKLIHNSDEKFDLCIVEVFSPAMMAFKDVYNCSLIIISSMFIPEDFQRSIGNPLHAVMYPDYNTAVYRTRDYGALWENIVMVYAFILFRVYYRWIALPAYGEIARKHFGGHIRELDDIQKDVDLMFANYHPVLMGIKPTVPGMINLGGLHVQDAKPLPKNLQDLLDRSTQGVVYFSLGTNVRSTALTPATRNALLAAFKELPYTVVWKWENETMEGRPGNVHVMQWLPQNDLLSHPNVRVFITQCGRQSMDEAIHHHVPMIGIPFFADQDLNSMAIPRFELGRVLNKQLITEEGIKAAVMEVIENPKYRENVKKLDSLLMDEPQSPMERAVWWTEYVLRNRGARHLRSPSADASWLQTTPLDVALLLLLICLLPFITLYAAIVVICWVAKSLKKTKQTMKNKQS